MAHAYKPNLVFQRNGRVHLNRRGSQFSRLMAAEMCASVVVMVLRLDRPCSDAECRITGYPLHSPLSPSLPLPCVTVCHQISTELYQGYLLKGKCGRCIGLTTLPPSCAVVMKSGNLNFLETSGPLQACNGATLPLQ